MRFGRRLIGGSTKSAFTLVELLLVVSLLLVIFGAIIFNFNSIRHGASLDEGAGQLETLFRFARAQAAANGRQVRVVFGQPAQPVTSAAKTGAAGPSIQPQVVQPAQDASSNSTNDAAGGSNILTPFEGGLVVGVEADPFKAPGRFITLREAVPYSEQITNLVRVIKVRIPGLTPDSAEDREEARDDQAFFGDAPSAGGTNADFTTPKNSDASPVYHITFYPDGSSDSATILLESQEDDDTRQVELTLVGITGAVRRRTLVFSEGEMKSDEPVTPDNQNNPNAPQTPSGQIVPGGANPR
jgi:type II secretory pathway pseudopilin PulG